MEKVLESQRCKIELGTEKNTSIKRVVSLEVMSGITDLTPPNNGSSISSMVELVDTDSKDFSLISDAESG